ncbi:MAG TPA: AMP-binding protein [Candidatus Krumholzibacteria bacterium]|nr:AMP-binding protein [Candidatus Krumholzibacteria bacterium]
MTSLTPELLVAAGLSHAEAESVAERYRRLAAGPDAALDWQRVSRDLLTPQHPHDVHRALYDAVFAAWPASKGPRPAWTPTEDEARATHIARALERLRLEDYRSFHRWSVQNREAFWRDFIATRGISFRTPPRRVLDDSRGAEHPDWLPGARMNIVDSCFLAPRDAPAIVHRRAGGPLESITYAELDVLSNRFARALEEAGVRGGVAIVMPMTVESVVAYLGIVKAGAVVVSIADSFAPEEIRTRMQIAGATVAVTQDVVVRGDKTLSMYDKLVAAGTAACIVVARETRLAVSLRSNDREWHSFLSNSERFDAKTSAPADPTNILFSSGTTGEPKAIPWSHTTPIKCAMDAYYHHDIRQGDVVAWPTNLGWMMGPWLIYASLVNRATLALCDDAPNTPAYCRFVADAEVTMLGVVPSLVKAWRTHDMTRDVDWSALRAFSSTGEASNADDYLWLMARARYRPVVEYCGGTEIGGGFITQALVQPSSPATFSTPALGLDLAIVDEDGRPTNHGELFVVPPSIGLSLSLLNRDHHDVYYEGTPLGPNGDRLRRHGDQFEVLPGGYYRAQGRADDTMNLGGIKVSSAEIERVVATVDGVTDAAAIAIEPPGGGPSLLVLYVVARDGDADSLRAAAQKAIASRLNPLFRVHEVRVVDSLPRTASNKVMRRVLRDQYRTR